MLFISSKKLVSSSRYSIFCISIMPFFSPVGQCFRGWWKVNLKVYDVMNCRNEKLITRFVWYPKKKKRYEIEIRILNKEYFYKKNMQKMCIKS